MPRKKKEEVEENENEATALTGDDSNPESVGDTNGQISHAAEGGNNDEGDSNESSVVSSVIETVSSVVGSVAEAISGGVSSVVSAITDSAAPDDKSHTRKRAEKIGMVSSDKMTKTVVVRVDRVVKHPVYRKYIKRRKKFMAHDELGSGIGDKVRIVETRPLSAKKRWRVVEIIQKAEK